MENLDELKLPESKRTISAPAGPEYSLPEMKRVSTAPVGPNLRKAGDFCGNMEPKQFSLAISGKSTESVDVNVPARDIVNRIPLYGAPFTSIFSEHSEDKINAMRLKIMEMGISSDQALAGIILTDAVSVSNAVNAIFELPKDVPAKHQYIAISSYAGDEFVVRHPLLNRLVELDYDRWPWNVPDESLCALCGLPEKLFHKGRYDLKNILQSPRTGKVSREISVDDGSITIEISKNDKFAEKKVSEISDAITCGICWDEMAKEKVFLAPCGHFYCKECLKQHYRTKIVAGDVLRLPCPYLDENNFPCDREIEEEEILSFCDDEMKTKFLKFKESRLIQLNDKARFCPKPGCCGWALGSKWNPKLTCKECGYNYCWKCTGDWHGYISRCVPKHDGLFVLFTLGKDIQSCPKCKVRIWKNDGCNHMTCQFCRYEFCWLCRGRYTENHYEVWNFLGCPGAMYFSWLRCPGWCPSYVNRFFIILFCFGVLLPLALGLASVMLACFLCLVGCWLGCWIITCIPGTYNDARYVTPCGCKELWFD